VNVVWDPILVAEAVFLLARADDARWATLRRLADPVPRSAVERLAAIDAVLFREWGAAALVEGALALAKEVHRALVARSNGPSDEGAELLVGETRSVLVRLRPERFLAPAPLVVFLRHEMRHVADMLDPAFGYRPDLGVCGRTRAQDELARDRYRVLWNLAIDQVETPPVDAATRRAQLDRAFAAVSEALRDRLAAAFRDPAARTHERLAAAARDPWAFLGASRKGGPSAGSPCPLCGFPTHRWDPAPPKEAIARDFPLWSEADGACVQCADIYRCVVT
jgi:hypothetical protein